MGRTKVRDGFPVDAIGMPGEQFPLAKRPKRNGVQEDGDESAPDVQLDEVSVCEIQVGDTVRARLYEGMRGRWFASQCRAGADYLIVRIEDAVMPSNGYYRSYPIRVAMSAGGCCFTLVSSDDAYIHRRSERADSDRPIFAVASVRRPVLPVPAPRALAADNTVVDCVYEEP
jgi:hypothetical protein